jgi:hypothetical protein
LTPAKRSCECLGYLRTCLSSFTQSCAPPASLPILCGIYGPLCARNGTFHCGDKDYEFTPPLPSLIKSFLEDRLEEFEDYWLRRIRGITRIIIRNLIDDSDGSIKLDLNFDYNITVSITEVIDDIKNDLVDNTGIDINRLESTINAQKRSIQNTGDVTLAVTTGTPASGPTGSSTSTLLSSLFLLAGFLLLLRLQ